MNFIEKLCKYREMQNAVVKPGQDILTSLTPERVNQWHMLTGLQDESTEFKFALKMEDEVNAREEIGDFIFYAVELLFSLGITSSQLKLLIETSIDPNNPLEVETDVMGTLKKAIIYNKELSSMQVFIIAEQLMSLIRDMYSYFRSQTPFPKFFQECMEQNMEKLLTGKNARYKEGGYSDAQAQERRDKQ